MTVTADHIERLRLLVADTSATPDFVDEELTAAIGRHACRDVFGVDPWLYDTSTTPWTPVGNDAWIPTYDIHAAAAEVWEWKAAALAHKMDFAADGGSYQLSQQHDHALRQAKYHRSRRKASSIIVGR